MIPSSDHPVRYARRLALLVLVATALLAALILSRVHHSMVAQEKARAAVDAGNHSRALERSLDYSLSAALALATYVRNVDDIRADFPQVAADIHQLYPNLSALALSPNGVITHISPHAGNEAALGFDQLAHEEQGLGSRRAIAAGELTVSGPMELVQGGRGIVGRHPVFVAGAEEPEFWGFTNVVIRLPQLLDGARLQQLRDLGLSYRLWRTEPATGEVQIIAEGGPSRLARAVEQRIELPNDEWVLSVEPDGGWQTWSALSGLMVVAALVTLLAAYVAKLVVELSWHRDHLEEEVEVRTDEVKRTQAYLQSVIYAIPDLLFELDEKGRYLNFFAHDPSRLEQPFEQIRGKTVRDVLPAAAAQVVLTALSEARQKRWALGHQFELSIMGERRHYELSVARKPEVDSEAPIYIVLSRDITDRKQAELEARRGLERFRSLVAASNTGAWEYFRSDKFLRCSPEYFSMLGRDIEAFDNSGAENLEQVWRDLIHPDDRAEAERRFQTYVKGCPEQLYEARYRMRHADGQWLWILSRGRNLRDESGRPTDVTLGTHIDISSEVANEAKLKLAAKVFERGSEGFIITDAQQNILMVNNAFTEITGYREGEVLGRSPKLLSSGRHGPEFYREMWQSLEDKGLWQGEVWNRRRDGSIYPEWLSISRIENERGETSNYIGIISDITRLKQDQEQIHRLAYYDPLTHLPNRLLLEERAEFVLRIAQRSGQSVSLLFLDLDNFKNINDSLGHHVGDKLLIAFAHRLSTVVREEDTFARPGGDEFILLLPDTDANGAVRAAQKLLAMLAEPFEVAGYELSVTSSIGIALYPEDGDSLNRLYTNADIAMYRAKHEGRNTYSFFLAEHQSQYVRTLQLENAMRRALELNQFELHYQPQQDLNTGAIVGVEALLRWRHPELGPISPAEFIPIAETSGLILPLGDWVLRTACAQLQLWHQRGLPKIRMAVNLSAHQFSQPNLPNQVLKLLAQAELPPHYLELELTESATMRDPERSIRIMEGFTQAGIKLSIDDFGTGYSSLSYLKRFNLDKLKIDQSFVRDLSTDAEDRAIVKSIIDLSVSLGLHTIAEGVETEEHRELLHAMGCNYIQGYLFSRPLPADELAEFLQQARDAPRVSL